MNLTGLDALIHEVIVDANGEDEQLWAFRQTATPERKDGHHPIIYMISVRSDSIQAQRPLDDVHFLNRHISLLRRQAKVCQPWNYLMLERGS